MSKKILLTIFLLIFSLTGGVGYAQIIITVAGNHAAGYTGDGGPAIATELWQPSATAIDAAGNIFIADGTNNCICRVNTSNTLAQVATKPKL